MAGSMAPRGVTKERAAEYKGHMTFAVAMACIVAAIGGSIFGYDIGISGTHRMTYMSLLPLFRKGYQNFI
jgi:hypothetical protein